jgi:hypothetical protein
MLFKPGQKAPQSGLYAIVDPEGHLQGKLLPMEQARTFPPTLRAARYILRQAIEPRYTSVASKVAIDETTRAFAPAIARLAKA